MKTHHDPRESGKKYTGLERDYLAGVAAYEAGANLESCNSECFAAGWHDAKREDMDTPPPVPGPSELPHAELKAENKRLREALELCKPVIRRHGQDAHNDAMDAALAQAQGGGK